MMHRLPNPVPPKVIFNNSPIKSVILDDPPEFIPYKSPKVVPPIRPDLKDKTKFVRRSIRHAGNELKLKHIPIGETFVIDIANVLYYNKNNLSRNGFEGDIADLMEGAVSIISDLLNHTNSVVVVMRVVHANRIHSIAKYLEYKFPKAVSDLHLRISLYIGPLQNGDDLICRKYSIERGYIIVSNDKMKKDEDKLIVSDSEIRSYNFNSVLNIQ